MCYGCVLDVFRALDGKKLVLIWDNVFSVPTHFFVGALVVFEEYENKRG